MGNDVCNGPMTRQTRVPSYPWSFRERQMQQNGGADPQTRASLVSTARDSKRNEKEKNLNVVIIPVYQ